MVGGAVVVIGSQWPKRWRIVEQDWLSIGAALVKPDRSQQVRTTACKQRLRM